MQTYVETLLLDQLRQAERFSAQQGIELRQYSIFAALPQAAGALLTEDAAQQGAAGEADPDAAVTPVGQEDPSGAAAVLEKLDAMQAANVRAQSANLTAQAAMTQSGERDGGTAGRRTGSVQEQTTAGRFSQTLLSGGVASRPPERSMREISRFFERDSRRYG